MDPLAEDDENLSPYIYVENNPVLMTDPDGMSSDSGKTPAPAPKPIQLKEVTIKGWAPKKQHFGSYTYITYAPGQAIVRQNQADVLGLLEDWTQLGRAIQIYVSTSDIAAKNLLKMSKTGTPRRKTAKQLRKEWEKATGKTWPKEPNDPTRNQVAHHIKPLADGGEDGYPNIEPKPADEHRSWHQMLGDFIRWGSTRVTDVD